MPFLTGFLEHIHESMYYGRPGDEEQALSSPAEKSTSNSSPVDTRSPEWANERDPAERRKIQNRLAQQRFRAKAKEQKEEVQREIENRRFAATAYVPPNAAELEDHHTLSGLPWGGLSMTHVIRSGQERSSQYSSQENSIYAMRAGGSSRLGLCLTDRFARGSAAWRPLRLVSQHFPE